MISHSQIAGGTGHYCRCIAFVNAYAQFCLLSRRMWISVTSAALVTGRRWMTREGNCSGACCWVLSKPATELSPSWVLVRPRLLFKMQPRDFYFRRLQPIEFRSRFIGAFSDLILRSETASPSSCRYCDGNLETISRSGFKVRTAHPAAESSVRHLHLDRESVYVSNAYRNAGPHTRQSLKIISQSTWAWTTEVTE